MVTKTPGSKSTGKAGRLPISERASYFADVEDELEAQRVAISGDRAGTKEEEVTKEPSEYGSGLSPNTIIGAEARRQRVKARQASFTGSNSGGGNQIADGRIMWYDPATGEPVTWAEVKSLARASGGYVGGFQFDPGISIEEWYDKSGGGQSWAEIFSYAVGTEVEGIDQFQFGSDGSSGSGSGSGRSSAVEATYIPPPAETVRDQVRSYVIATTGTANQEVIDSAMKTFMDADRQAFDQRETAQIDAWQQMKETVRGTRAYRAVNDGRPDSVDEMDWVTGMQAKLRSIGLSATKAETLGISGAIAGNTDEALVDAAEMQQVQSTGRMLKSQRDSLKRSAASVARLVV